MNYGKVTNLQGDDELRSSKLTKITKSSGPDFLTYMLENDPRTIRKALSTPEAPLWKEAINSKLDSIMQNHTWEFIDHTLGNKLLGCKWFLKRKYKADGSIVKYKAGLLVKEFKQKEGLDFCDIYSPVMRITSIRVLLAIASLHDLDIHQMDVKTTFQNCELEKEIHMEQPKGFVVPGQGSKVCKLVKSLYILKQAPKQWQEKFNKSVLSNGLKSMSVKCVSIKSTPKEFVIICLLCR